MNNLNNQDLHNLKCCNKSVFSLLIVILVIFFVILSISVAVGIVNKVKQGRYIGQDIESRNTITVSDTGEIYAKPDLAITTFSVVTEAKTVEEAMKENTEKMNKVISSVKEQGVEDKDLKTTSFNIYPRYEYRKTGVEIYPYPSGQRVLVGYEIYQSLQVKIRDMEKIGKIIEGATSAGSNQVGDLQFTIDKQDELKSQARDQAIEKAKAKAKELADQLGVKLVRITNFSESSYTPRFYEFDKAMSAIPEAGIGGGVEIETGENKITANVSITYEIN